MATVRHVLITGAARGLGRVMTEALLKAGHRVIGTDLPGAEALFAGLPGERFSALHFDVGRFEECARAVETAIARLGHVDVLVNNAGIGTETVLTDLLSRSVPFYDVPPEKWRRIVSTNLFGTLYMAKAALPHMMARRAGRLVNVVTSYATMVRKGFSPYGPTKAAIEAATAIWSKDLAPFGIAANALLPGGAADTRMVPDPAADRAKLIRPSVMAAPIVYLCSDAAEGVTGQRIVGNDWDPALPAAEAFAKAKAPAGWDYPV